MKERPKDLTFYEWRFPMWRTSATRDMLDASGRGIYRELLDQCYAQGEFPDDAEYICRVCACSRDEFERAWKVIEKHFPKRKNGARSNRKADLSRREYATYIQSQRDKRKKGIEKSNGIKVVDNSGSTNDDSRNDLTRTRTRTRTQQEQGHQQGNESAVATEAQPAQAAAAVVMLDESQPGFWAERWYERHPKKRDLVLVFGPVQKLFESGGLPLMRLIDQSHRDKCLSDEWLRDGGRFVPSLAKWLEDRGWTAPAADSPMQQSKFAGAFRFFDERESR